MPINFERYKETIQTTGGFEKFIDRLNTPIKATPEKIQTGLYHFHSEIKTASDFELVFERLDETQRRQAYQNLKTKLLTHHAIIKTARDFFLALTHLNETERREAYTSFKPNFDTLIKNATDFSCVARFLPEDLQVDLYSHQRDRMKIRKPAQFNLVAKYIPQEQRNDLFTPFRENPKELEIMLSKADDKYEINTLAKFLTADDQERARLAAEPTKKAIKNFLLIYNALLSLASFSFFRFNKWKKIKDVDSLSDADAKKTWEKITTHAESKNGSTSNVTLNLLREWETTNENSAVDRTYNISRLSQAAIVAAYQRTALPLCSPIRVNNPKNLKAPDWKKFFTQQEITALTGRTVEKIQTKLALIR